MAGACGAGAYAKMCDVQLQGADAHVRGLPGGLDGIYAVSTCEGGRPAFLRKRSPPGGGAPDCLHYRHLGHLARPDT